MGIFKPAASVPQMIANQLKDVDGCLVNFEGFMRAAIAPGTPHTTLKALCVGVHEKENAADHSLRAMIDTLAEGILLPSTREDLINVATACDKIANKCESTAKLIVLYKLVCPAEFGDDIINIMGYTRTAFDLLVKSVEQLFSNYLGLLKDHSILDEIRAEESKVDALEQKLNEAIFDMDIDLAHQLQLAKVIEEICDLSDVIENIADKIQIMLINKKV